MDNLRQAKKNSRYAFVKADICDAEAVGEAIEKHKIEIIANFAAETHVDRSIMDPDAFIKTDVYGTYVLLEACQQIQAGEVSPRFNRRDLRPGDDRGLQGNRSL